jgi:D-inositol-3-phosphate glycosyltransferase
VKISLVYSACPGRAAGNVDPSSVRAHVTGLAEALEQRGNNVTVDALRHDPLERMGRTVRRLEAMWTEREPDLVHAHLWTSGLAALAAIRQSSALRTIPVVQTFHSLDPSDTSGKSHEWLRLEAAVARGVNRIAASSRRQLADLVSLGARRRDIDVIPRGVDTDLFTPDGPAAPKGDGPRLVAAGPVIPAAGFDVAIHATPGLPDTELVIAGGRPPAATGRWSLDTDDEVDRLRRLADKLGVADRVRIIDLPPRHTLPKLLRSADIVVCTPSRETPSTTVIEAMACGRPIVAAAVGELLDIVIEGTTGTLVPPRNPTALTRALRDLLHDPIRLDGFGLAAADRARVRHAWPRVTDEVTRAYERTLAG